MDVSTVIDEVLGASTYVGNFRFDELMLRVKSQLINGLGVSDENQKKLIIIFEKGDPAGAILIEEKGALFGEKAAYHLQDRNDFELFSTEPSLVSALVSRSRVYDRMHIEKRLSDNLPTIGPKKSSPGVLCLIILKDGALQSGMRVSIRKGRQVIGNDITADDGRACFKLLNGRYDCVVVDRSQEMYTFMVDFKDRYAESTIDIGE